jgi:inner membrane protein
MALLAGILIILYGFLFVILRSEDYALLIGSIGLFIVLCVIMYLSRKIKWYGDDANEQLG